MKFVLSAAFNDPLPGIFHHGDTPDLTKKLDGMRRFAEDVVAPLATLPA